MKNIKIDILMATYNAEKYLRKQLDSITRQKFKGWRLVVRDDASRDGTVKLLESYAKKYYGKIKIIKGDVNVGAKMNFAKLIKYSKADYVMFSDQDDIWLPDKICKTLSCMLNTEERNGRKIPILVHTDLAVIDENGQRKSNSFWKYQKINENLKNFNRLLAQNNVTGCTLMINKALMKIATPIPKEAIMHDWWFALVASVFGHIEHLDYRSVLYRQHDKNVLGAKKWGLSLFYKKAWSFEANRQAIINTIVQATKFKKIYCERLDTRNLSRVEIYSRLREYNYISRIILIIKHRYFKYGFLRNLGFLFIGIRQGKSSRYIFGASIAILLFVVMTIYLINGQDGRFIRGLSKICFFFIIFTIFNEFVSLLSNRKTIDY